MYQNAQPLVTAVMGSAPTMPLDTRRNNKYLPGQLVHTVIMDQQALECCWCCATMPCCCYNEVLARATYMDIYTNGVEIGKPCFCCCCGSSSTTSIATFQHFDNFVVFNESVVKGELCSPFPYCCVNNCDMCGEVIVMRGRCCSGTSTFALGNQWTTCAWPIPCHAWFCPISVMYGLAPGEASRASELINQTMSQFKSGNWPKEPRVQMALNPAPIVMIQGAAPGVYQQQPQAYQQAQVYQQPQQQQQEENFTPIMKDV